MTGDSPYFNCSYRTDADVQFMSLEEQAFSNPCFEDYYDAADIKMTDAGCSLDGSTEKEEDAMDMFMNFE